MFNKDDQVDVLFNTRQYPGVVLKENKKTVTVRFKTQHGELVRRIDKERVSHTTSEVGPEFTNEEQNQFNEGRDTLNDNRTWYQRLCDWFCVKMSELFG